MSMAPSHDSGASPNTAGAALTQLGLNHVELYVTDVRAKAETFRSSYGFHPLAERHGDDRHSIALGQGDIVLVLTEAKRDDDPAAVYVQCHGDGVAHIGLRSPDPATAFRSAVQRGAVPAEHTCGDTPFVIAGFGDVVHSFVPSLADDEPIRHVPGFTEPVRLRQEDCGVVRTLDHFAVAVAAGALDATTAYYKNVLGFAEIFSERIEVGAQAMNSQVVQNATGDVTFTIVEPDASAEPGQIDDFVKDHGGPGVQHIAFGTTDITRTVAVLRDRGVEFLDTPDAYYEGLPDRVGLPPARVAGLRRLGVLVDSDHDGMLMQIFTRSVHPRGTIFLEVIQRLGARTFGSGNIRALYESVERDRVRG
jgi:4-hydroxymandelate synthase